MDSKKSSYNLEAVREDYEGRVISVSDVAIKHGITLRTLQRLVREEGWRPRSPKTYDRNDMIMRMFGLLESQIRKLEKTVSTESPTDQVALLSRMVNTLDRLIAIKDAETAKHRPPQRSSKAMVDLRVKIADRIAQFAKP